MREEWKYYCEWMKCNIFCHELTLPLPVLVLFVFNALAVGALGPLLTFVDKTAITSFLNDDLNLINEPPTTQTLAAAIMVLNTSFPCRFTALNLLDPADRVKVSVSASCPCKSGRTVNPPMTLPLMEGSCCCGCEMERYVTNAKDGYI